MTRWLHESLTEIESNATHDKLKCIEHMEISRFIDKYDLLLTPNFLDDLTCQQVIQEAQASGSNPATVYGHSDVGSVDDRVRKASRLRLSATTTEFVHRRLIEHKKMVERHFSISLNDCEEPQFLSLIHI